MTRSVKIYYTSDIHGYIFPHFYHNNQETNIGLAKISAYIQKHRDENTIFIDNGDILEGSQLLDYYNEFPSDNHPFKEVMKLAQVDYVNLGNHDFNYGTKTLNDYLSNLKCITTNISFNQKPFGQTVIHQFKNGLKVALIGVCTQHIIHWEKPQNLVGVTLKDAFSTLKQEVKQVRKHVDFVVGVYHGGFERDIQTGKIVDALNGENQAYQMCQEITGLDVLLTGHQHRILNETLNNVKILQPSMAGEYLGEVILKENKEIETNLIKVNQQADQTILEYLKELEINTQKWLDKPIVNLNYDLSINDGFQARLHKHQLVSLLNQIQLYYTQADLSAIALFNNATGFKQNLTMRDLTTTYVYPNTLVILETDYSNLKLFLEKCAEYFTIKDDGEIGIDPDFYITKPQHYNYDMVDGIEYTIQVSKPKGQRILSITKDGKELDQNKKYTLVVNNYRASGGGDFEMVKNMKLVKTIEESMVKLIYDYLVTFKNNLIINHKENIKVIK